MSKYFLYEGMCVSLKPDPVGEGRCGGMCICMVGGDIRECNLFKNANKTDVICNHGVECLHGMGGRF